MASCAVEGCPDAVKVKVRGLCQRHYNRWYRTGSVEPAPRLSICAGCGASLPAYDASPRGRAPRKWCSQACRMPQRRALESVRFKERYVPAARKACINCGERSVVNREDFLYCSSQDCQRVKNRERTREYFRRIGGNKYRKPEHEAARRERNRGKPPSDAQRATWQRRRARKAGALVEKFTRAEVFERDGWVCGICSDPVDPALKYPNPLSPSVDHVIPLAHGGPHTFENVRLAHLTCNVKRGAARDAQVAS